MIDPQRKTLKQFQHGIFYYLACSTLMMSVAISSAVAEDATGKLNTLATTKEVFFTEIKQANNGDLGKIIPLGEIVVSVVPGDSLSSILQEHLGSLSAMEEVTRYNNLDTPDSLEPGQKILIPASLFPIQSDTQLVQLVNSPATLVNLDSANQSTESEGQYVVVDLTEIDATPDRRIRVNRGDSLSSILRENLGSLRALREVARYNSLDTPDTLKPGQIILIPGHL